MPAVSIYLTQGAHDVWKTWISGTRSKRISDFIMSQSMKNKVPTDGIASMPDGGYTNLERVVDHNRELVERIQLLNALIDEGISEKVSSGKLGVGEGE